MVSSSKDEGSGDWHRPKNGTEEEEEEEGSVKQRVPQLRKKFLLSASPRLVRIFFSSFNLFNDI